MANVRGIWGGSTGAELTIGSHHGGGRQVLGRVAGCTVNVIRGCLAGCRLTQAHVVQESTRQ